MSTLKVNSIEPANAGSEDYFLARAWVTVSDSSVTILNSGNVSSVTDGGVGIYTANFSSTLLSANFAKSVTANYTNSTSTNTDGHYTLHETSLVRFGSHGSGSNSLYDSVETSLIVLG